jgi:hypothetical protein
MMDGSSQNTCLELFLIFLVNPSNVASFVFLAFAYCFSNVCNLAVYFRKYWSVLLGLDQRRMSGLMFASMSDRALYHVNHQNVLQFFLEISYFVFRWEFMQVPVRNVFTLVKRGVILIRFWKLLCSNFRKVKSRLFTLMPMSLMRKEEGMM